MRTIEIDLLIKELKKEKLKGKKLLQFEGTILVDCSVIISTKKQF